MESIKRILILVDETPSSENVVKCGYGIARQLSAEVALPPSENRILAFKFIKKNF